MSTPNIVKAFYEHIWNAGDLDAAGQLLAENVSFRGSLGDEMRGRESFKDYVRAVRGALDRYHCEILECVAEQDFAFAKMRFSGIHKGFFRGHEPTGRLVVWHGAAFFRMEEGVIIEVWVLGDLAGLDAVLKENSEIC
ncbi:MAG: hypothetical protein JWP03_2395 [Phycisphaerales bacterium]|jgi:predicted ester cyclase|nr:hypothetical protein [Phycisphaerales bacterium]